MRNNLPNRRKTYFIKKSFQRNFIIKFCILVIIGAVLSGSLIYVFSSATVTTTFENCRLQIKSTADFILPAVLLSGAVVVTLIGLASVAVTLFTSHRIAGPLYRIKEDLKQLAGGNLKIKFNLRQTDEIQVLAEGLDKMTQSLRCDVGEIKRLAEQLRAELTTGKKVTIETQKDLQELIKILDKFTV